MIALRTPVSLRHLVVAGGQRNQCIGGDRKRGRAQRRHFTGALESLWRHGPHPCRPQAPAAAARRGSDASWQPPVLENAAFEEYYKEQQIVREEEWDAFMSVLRKPLPATFRINASCRFLGDICSKLENDFRRSLECEVSEYGEDFISPLTWYPGNLAWRLNFSRKQLRKTEALESFHEFLKHESEVGNITRQEAVSMVPPLFLNVQPDHHILDMCAAPGSKTFQLLEMIHQSKEPGLLPRALVIANDFKAQRCDLLIHNTKRMCTANLIVTNHDAQNFPSCSLAKEHSETEKDHHKPQRLEFDSVLCDVPCSGDGTIRKSHDMWRKWNSSMGNEFHLLQVNIAMRGIALLKVGGRMVYSTCSMNPIENEAVVAELLRRSGNSVELLDVSKELPELVRRPGLSTWKVNDRGSWWQTHEDVSHDRKNVILPSMFPSSKSKYEGHVVYNNVDAKLEYSTSFSRNFKIEEMSNVNCDTGGVSTSISTQSSDYTSNSVGSKSPLSRCMRIIPHDQDGGAFFIAVIHKLSPLNESQMTEVGKTEHPLSTTRTVGLQEQYQPEITAPVKKMMHQHGIVSEVRGDNKLPVEQKKLSVDNQTSKHNNLIGAKMETDDVKHSQTKSGDISHGTKKLDCQYKWKGIDPVLFFEDDAVIKNIVSFFGIEETFSLEGRLVTRSTDNARRIYYISKSVQEILELNVQVGEQIKIASVGVKMFERHRSKDGCSCAYRLSYEGLSLLFPYMRKRILCASPVDFQQLLQCRTINFAHFTDARFGEEASSLMPGCCVVVLREGHQDADSVAMDPSTIAIVCWRGKSTMNVLVSPPDRKELLEYRFGFKEFKVEDEKPNKDITGLDEGN
ncbi:RNA cytosine-C(5)-methyltransferase NSUN2-like isoform X1 [Lolium rigidum]|uniref:RNA cytosine-C(5)-methyltransferase NSUN2-like isoform X1 n=1 Tax=Lolium rigidum TaxID=89674 RepID=UPI001F5CCAFE|nr:RNA cytosine-C(5)-methyltransferase NSUN2-like isoform X1 [Lolium rigidum]